MAGHVLDEDWKVAGFWVCDREIIIILLLLYIYEKIKKEGAD